ncbi:DUF6333 family protein [Streptomyces sp. NPDC053427]|uniref:DUF6333 family protein n=1 Tax=Streptomyces sp. NPDC053427 TaxID=3365701 RepID=UPI0037D6F339
MTDNGIWDYPPDAPVVRDGSFTLTVINNPAPHEIQSLPQHDHARAREVAASLVSVAGVAAELGRRRATDRIVHDTRADLEQVRIGCWGPVTEISDPALAYRGGFFPLAEQAEALAEQNPGAAVIGSARIDFSIRYGAWIFIHPGGKHLWAEGWPGDDPWSVEGSVEDILGVFEAHTELDSDFDVDADPSVMDFSEVEDAVLGSLMPIDRRKRLLSTFRVERTQEAAAHLEETWLEE